MANIIKKKAATKKSIENAALRLGGSVTTEDGTKFNTSREKVKPTRRKPTKKATVAKPEPSPPPVATKTVLEQKDVTDAIKGASTSMVKALEELKVQVSNIQLEAAQPPTEWVFDIIRDEKGNLKQIKANTVSKRLNS